MSEHIYMHFVHLFVLLVDPCSSALSSIQPLPSCEIYDPAFTAPAGSPSAFSSFSTNASIFL